MSCTSRGTARETCAPLVGMLVEDALAARRIVSVLEADGMDVAAQDRIAARCSAGCGVEPDAVVVTCGRGAVERDQRIRGLRKRLPDVHVIAVIREDSRRGARRAIEAGAEGVVFDSRVERVLPLTVRAVLAGQTTVPAAARRDIDPPAFSRREKQVLGMIVRGMSNKAIAAELYLAQSTVKSHVSSVFAKLGVRSRNEAAELILRSGTDLGPGATEGNRLTELS